MPETPPRRTAAIYNRIKLQSGDSSPSAGDNVPSEYEINLRRHDREEFKRVQDAMASLDRVSNSSHSHRLRAGILVGLLQMHRYLQNQVIIEMIQALGDFAALVEDNEARYTDARNIFAAKVCMKLRKALEDDLFYLSEDRK